VPELPEVETVMRGLRPVLEGRRLTRVEANRADLRWPIPADLRQRLTGAVVTGIGRRAKYGLVATDRGDTMILHLGMSGRVRLDPETAEKHDHIVFETEDGRRAVFNDARRFGSVHLVETELLAEHPLIRGLGPEPLEGALDLAAAFGNRIAPAKALLLDQRVVAGLGNIYVCEALFDARVRPTRAGGRVTRAEITRLEAAIPEVLNRAIQAGGSTLRDYARPDGELGYFQHEFRVYGREGEPCGACGRAIRRIVQSGRSSFYCPACQK
jgi:formamidopyrimidine-DNA glycosylase